MSENASMGEDDESFHSAREGPSASREHWLTTGNTSDDSSAMDEASVDGGAGAAHTRSPGSGPGMPESMDDTGEDASAGCEMSAEAAGPSADCSADASKSVPSAASQDSEEGDHATEQDSNDGDTLASFALPESARSGEVTVRVGTSADVTSDFVRRVTIMVCRAYGYMRVSPRDVVERLCMGDGDESTRNRVLHLAFRGPHVVGCCSSTKRVPWCPPGCGHWGLLVVDPAVQGTGVASALVKAAETRIRDAGLPVIQMEYEYTCGDAESERLRAWYEGKLGYKGNRGPASTRAGDCEWRGCRRVLLPGARVVVNESDSD